MAAKPEPPHPLIEKLREVAPHVGIVVSRMHDDMEGKWKGDAPDPRKSGYKPYVIVVTATMVQEGRVTTGESFLSSSYYRPNQPIGDAHGYLPQKIGEALDELAEQAPSIDPELTLAQAEVRAHSQRAYEAQRREIEAGTFSTVRDEAATGEEQDGEEEEPEAPSMGM